MTVTPRPRPEPWWHVAQSVADTPTAGGRPGAEVPSTAEIPVLADAHPSAVREPIPVATSRRERSTDRPLHRDGHGSRRQLRLAAGLVGLAGLTTVATLTWGAATVETVTVEDPAQTRVEPTTDAEVPPPGTAAFPSSPSPSDASAAGQDSRSTTAARDADSAATRGAQGAGPAAMAAPVVTSAQPTTTTPSSIPPSSTSPSAATGTSPPAPSPSRSPTPSASPTPSSSPTQLSPDPGAVTLSRATSFAVTARWTEATPNGYKVSCEVSVSSPDETFRTVKAKTRSGSATVPVPPGDSYQATKTCTYSEGSVSTTSAWLNLS